MHVSGLGDEWPWHRQLLFGILDLTEELTETSWGRDLRMQRPNDPRNWGTPPHWPQQSQASPAPSNSLHRRPVSVDTVILTLICLADLVSTLYLVSHGQAREGNPLMAQFLRSGSGTFVLAKLCTFVPAIVIGEWYRPRNPRLVSGAMWFAILAYVAVSAHAVGPELQRFF